jgi:hypothetical protein
VTRVFQFEGLLFLVDFSPFRANPDVIGRTLSPRTSAVRASVRDARLPDALRTSRVTTMTKKMIALATVATVATVTAASAVAATHPDESRQLTTRLAAAAARTWDGIEANPLPMVLALGTFSLTIVYHKLRGKSLRESLAAAATRVTLVPVPAPAHEPENAVLARARARATRTQLIADQIGLENRYRKLPDDVKRAEKEVCYTEQAVTEAEQALTDAEHNLEAKLAASDAAVARLESLRKDLAAGEAELAAIAAELKKLAEVV